MRRLSLSSMDCGLDIARRRFLQIPSGVALIGGGFSALAGSQVRNRRHRPRSLAEQGTRGPLAKFVDPLPLPSTMEPVSVSNGIPLLVNGIVWPFLEVEPRKYRFRILNGSNARFYHLTLNGSTKDGERLGQPGPAFVQIGTDGGFLSAPVTLTDLTISPGERCDAVIDFSGADGSFFTLNNDARAPFPDGDDVVPPDVMLFKVTKRLGQRDTSTIPATLPAPAMLDPTAAVRVRDLLLLERASAQDNPVEALINTHYRQPVTETPRVGSTEIWRIINTTEDAHPIHLHLVQFQILDRQPFDVERFPPRLRFTGPLVPPPSHERGAPKDTVQAFPGEVTRLTARFDLPSGTRIGRGDRFRYVFHCHILEHEDNEMMRPYDVVG